MTASSPPWCIAFEPHHDDAHIVLVVCGELLAAFDISICGQA
jgi:hypothetical protein